MKMTDVFAEQLQNAHNRMVLTLQELNAAQLNYRPNDNQHGIGFAIWHALRSWDRYYALITQTALLYEEGNWASRFGFDTRGKGEGGAGLGTGFTPQDVAEMSMSVEPLREFLETLSKNTCDNLSKASDDVLLLDAVVPWWNQPVTTSGRVLTHIVAHTFNHIGEADYVRGLLNK